MGKMFKKATTEVAKLKVAFYGEAGSGKTYTALLVATNLGKTAVIDTEHGTDLYATEFDFDVLHTRSLKTVLEVLDSEEINEYDCIIVDSITHLWEDAQESFLKALEKSSDPKKRKKAELGEITFADWRFIKRPYRKLITKLLQIDKHVFICGRQTVMYEFQNGELVQVGVRMRAEGETPYEPHILVHMEAKDGKIIATVEKDRSGTIMGKSFVNPTTDMFAPVLEKLGYKHSYFDADEWSGPTLFAQEVTKRKMEKTSSQTLVKNLPGHLKEKIHAALKNLPEDLLNEFLTRYQKESIDDLTYEEVKTIWEESKKVQSG